MSGLNKKLKGSTNEELRKIYNTKIQNNPTRKKGLIIKKHNCLNNNIPSGSKSEAFLINKPNRANNRSVKISTIEGLEEENQNLMRTRSSSSGPPIKSDNMFKFKPKRRCVNAERQRNTNNNVSTTPISGISRLDLPEELNQSLPTHSRSEFDSKTENIQTNTPVETPKENFVFSDIGQSAEDHEYLLFLLRITEEILSNDFYSNDDIKKIFKTHISLNKNRLTMIKMQQHIANLCVELNIDCEEFKSPQLIEEFMRTKKKIDSPRYMNNKAFQNCSDCSIIRTSSLYNNYYESNNKVEDELNISVQNLMESNNNNGEHHNLIKLLERMSLGRVTERTEPMASNSTVNSVLLLNTTEISPRKLIEVNNNNNNNNNATNNEEIENKITDADDNDNKPKDFETFINELNLVENVPVLPSNVEISSESENGLINLTNCLTDETNNYERNEDKIISLENYKPSLKHEVETCRENRSEEINKKDLALENLPESAKTVSPTNNEVKIMEKAEIIEINNNNSTFSMSPKITQLQPNVIPSLTNLTTEKINLNNNNSSNCENNTEISRKETDDNNDLIIKNEQLKVILHNDGLIINDEDYVMIKGPIYVYKPLLNCTDPKLVICPANDEEEITQKFKTRRNSGAESATSHKTFTVEQIQPIDLHSKEYDNSIDDILEKSGKLFNNNNNPLDLKLFESDDYDLTPQKDENDDDNNNKYHHLLQDVATSVSGINLFENLLMNDEYLLLENDNNDDKLLLAEINMDINNKYAKSYVVAENNNNSCKKKLLQSMSMPKLQLNYEKMNNNRNLKKIHSEMLSQSSSIKSEGETTT